MSNGDKPVPKDLLQRIVAWLDESVIGFLIDKLGDPGAKSALLETMGLDPGLAGAMPDPDLPAGARERIREYAKAADGSTDLAAFVARANDVFQVLNAVVDVVEAARAAAREAGDDALEGGKAAADEALRQLVSRLNLEFLRRRLPFVYDVQKLLGFIDDTLASHYSDELFFSRIKRFVLDTGDYLDEAFATRTPEDEAEAKLASDTFFVLLAIVLWRLTPFLRAQVSGHIPEIRPRYGWEIVPPPEGEPPATPIADAIASRTLTLGLRGSKSLGDVGAGGALTLTSIFVPREHGGPGMFVQFDGDLEVQVPLGKKYLLSLAFDPNPALDFFLPFGDEAQDFDAGAPAEGKLAVTFAARTPQSAGGPPPPTTPSFSLPISGLRLEVGPLADVTGTIKYPKTPGGNDWHYSVILGLRDSALVLDFKGADDKVDDNHLKKTITKRVPGRVIRLDFQLLAGLVDNDFVIGFGPGTESKLRAQFPGGFNVGGLNINNLFVAMSELAGQVPNAVPESPSASGIAPAVAFLPPERPVFLAEADSPPGSVRDGGFSFPERPVFLAEADEEGGLGFTLATTISYTFRGFSIAIENVGVILKSLEAADPADLGEEPTGDGDLKVARFDVAFKPPNSLALGIKASGISGGGYALFDPENHEYAGAVHLRIKDRFNVNAFLLLNTRLPDDSKTFSLLVSLSGQWSPPLQLGAGFTFHGLGGIFGWERGIDVDVLRDGLRAGSLDAVLMPKDPMADLPRLLGVVRTLFPPARDTIVAGLLLKFGWGTPALVEFQFGAVFELPRDSLTSPRKVLIVGQLKIFQPRDVGTLSLRLDGLGVIDNEKDETTVDLTLFDSKVMGYALKGDAIYRSNTGDEDAFVGLSIGGFHPDFPVPTGIPKLNRVSLSLTKGDNPRLRGALYLAITSNSVQVGARLDFYYSKSGFTIEAAAGFDVLYDKPTGKFLAELYASATVKWHGRTLFGVEVSGTFGGTTHCFIRLRAKVSIWIWSHTFCYDKTLREVDDAEPLAASDPLPDVIQALREPANWSTQPPAGERSLVSLREIQVEGAVVSHPLGRIGVRQQVAPFGIELQRYKGARPRRNRRLTIQRVLIDGTPAASTRSVTELFAPGEFLELSDDQALARPSFEKMQSGVEVAADLVRFGGQDVPDDMTSVDLDFETLLIDDRDQPSQNQAPHRPAIEIAMVQVAHGAVSRRQRARAGPLKYGDQRRGPALQAPAYAIATRTTLAVETAAGDQASGTSYTDAVQTLERFIKNNPARRGDLQVVAQPDVVEEAA